MSTIHSTSNREYSDYTVIGGTKPDRDKKEKRGLSIVLLNRGGRPFRRDLFDELTALGALEVISIEPPSVSYDLELLTRKHPELRFVLLSRDVSPGERVNVGIKEATGRYVFVLWNDMHIKAASISSRVLQKIAERENMCTVPLLQNSKNETIPSCFAPAFSVKGGIEVVPLNAVRKDLEAIYPFDYCGIYDREKFLLSGGYDSMLKNSFWQKMDFGFRSHMWGEKIVANTAVKINYQNEIPYEDTTIDKSYKLFFLKTLSVRFNGDAGYLPRSRFFPFWIGTGTSFPGALSEFRLARRWVKENRYRFKRDAMSITELWDGEE